MAGDHVFESYIRTTPEELWRAFTDGSLTTQYYYGFPVESTWQVGALCRYATPAGSLVEGVVHCRRPVPGTLAAMYERSTSRWHATRAPTAELPDRGRRSFYSASAGTRKSAATRTGASPKASSRSC